MRMSRHLGVYHRKNWIYDLFAEGMIDTKLTGGLAVYDYVPSTSGSIRQKPTFTQADGAITLELSGTELGSGGALFTESPLDLTSKKTICIEVKSAKTLEGYVTFGATSTKGNSFVQAARKNILGGEAGTVTNTTFRLDVSALSGSYYLYVALFANYNKSITFTRWWVE